MISPNCMFMVGIPQTAEHEMIPVTAPSMPEAWDKAVKVAVKRDWPKTAKLVFLGYVA